MNYSIIFAVIIATFECSNTLNDETILNPTELEQFREVEGSSNCLLFEGPPQSFTCALDVIRDVIVDKLKLPQLRYEINAARRMENGSILFDVGPSADVVLLEAIRLLAKSRVFHIKNGNCAELYEADKIPIPQKKK